MCQGCEERERVVGEVCWNRTCTRRVELATRRVTPVGRLTSENLAVIVVASSTSDAIAAGAMASAVRCLVLRCSAAEHEASRDGLRFSSGVCLLCAKSGEMNCERNKLRGLRLYSREAMPASLSV